LELEGSRLLVSGMLDGSALKAFEAHLAGGHVRTVVFENSLGGSADVAREYARLIQASGVNTEARGQCQAACAYAFLAGKEHRFAHGFQVNALLIPLPGRPARGALASRWRGEEVERSLDAFITPVGDEGAHHDAPGQDAAPVRPGAEAAQASAARERCQPSQGVLFTSTPTLFGRVHNTFYCDGTQGRDVSRCELLPDA